MDRLHIQVCPNLWCGVRTLADVLGRPGVLPVVALLEPRYSSHVVELERVEHHD